MKKILTVLTGALCVTIGAGWQGQRLAVPFWIPPAKQPPKVVVSIPQPPPVVDPVPVSVGPITLRVTPSQTHAAGPGELWVHVAVRAPGERTSAHAPTDWILVIDRSGSMMARGKMKHAKAAARFLAQNLPAHDRIALVGFDHVANILHPLSAATDRGAFDGSVEGLFPRGSTNILEGLRLGLSAVDSSATDRVRRILFLTDGMDSFGEQNAHTMRQLAREAGRNGVSITTMGMGAEFQEDLLVQIAEASGGRYVYLGDPSQMSTLYKEELSHGGAVRATDLTLTLTYGAPVQASMLVGSDGESVATRQQQVILGTLAAGETRNLMVKIGHNGGAGSLLELRLDGKVVGQGAGPLRVEQSLALERAANAAEADASVNPLVIALAEKFQLANVVEGAMNMVAQGKKQEAQQLLEKEAKDLSARASKSGAAVDQDRRNLEQVLKDVNDLNATDADSLGAFVKQQKWNAYQWRR